MIDTLNLLIDPETKAELLGNLALCGAIICTAGLAMTVDRIRPALRRRRASSKPRTIIGRAGNRR